MILVTGASGLVGSHLLKCLLEKQEKVKAFVRTRKSIDKVEEVFKYYNLELSQFNNNLEWIFGDITNNIQVAEAFKDVSKVFHCAAAVSFNEKDKRLIHETNIRGTEIVVNCCLQHNIEKIVHISSIAAIKKSGKNKEIVEDNGWPSGKMPPYAYSKTHSEFEVWRGMAEGLNAVVVNPSIILGPGNWQSGSSLLFDRVYQGSKYFTRGITGFVDVRDVVNAIDQLMESDVHTKRFILNGTNLSYESLFKSMAKYLKVRAPKKHAKPFITEFAWRMAKLFSILTFTAPKLTKSAARASHRVQLYSSERIKNEIGFEFRPIDETIRYTCEKYLESIS